MANWKHISPKRKEKRHQHKILETHNRLSKSKKVSCKAAVGEAEKWPRLHGRTLTGKISGARNLWTQGWSWGLKTEEHMGDPNMTHPCTSEPHSELEGPEGPTRLSLHSWGQSAEKKENFHLNQKACPGPSYTRPPIISWDSTGSPQSNKNIWKPKNNSWKLKIWQQK